MASKVVVDAVRARMAANFAGTTTFYPNEALRPPADMSPFVVVEFPVGSASRFSLAREGTHIENGAVRFVVHVPIGAGMDAALTMADSIAAVFRSVKFSEVEVFAPSPPIPIGDDGGWYKCSFSVPYTVFF